MRSVAMKRLWAEARKYDVTSEELHLMSKAELGEEHISKLNEKSLNYLIWRITGKGSAPSLPGKVSPKQIGYIKHLEKELGWDICEKRLLGFISKYAKGKKLEDLTMGEASRIIEGLKKILERADAG